MDYVDEVFMNNDASPEHKQAYLECLAIAKPYIDKWNEDPLADHHALHAEMRAKILDVLRV